MAGKKGSLPSGAASQSREDRLKAALKANLARRKAQNRKRTHAVEPEKNNPGTAGQEKDA